MKAHTATDVGTRSHLLSTKTRCLCGASSLKYFSTLLHRVLIGSLASRTCSRTLKEVDVSLVRTAIIRHFHTYSDESITL